MDGGVSGWIVEIGGLIGQSLGLVLACWRQNMRKQDRLGVRRRCDVSLGGRRWSLELVCCDGWVG